MTVYCANSNGLKCPHSHKLCTNAALFFRFAHNLELRLTFADDVVRSILHEAADFDQIIIGASEERLLEQTLFGSIPQRVAEEALTNVIMVKQHDLVKFGLRRWLTRPRRNNN